MGLVGGLFRIWLPILFLMSALGFASGLSILVGPRVFSFIESESRQELAGFFLIFVVMLAVGLVITRAVWHPLSIASALMSVLPGGGLLNRVGGMLLGVLSGLVLLSVVLIGLQQYPVPAVGRAIAESTVASGPIGWVDRYVASLEISEEWQ